MTDSVARRAALQAMSLHQRRDDPHADRAYTDDAVDTHTNATDPHGDRAYSDSQLDARVKDWSSLAPEDDWVPATDDQWIGDADQHPRGIALGNPTGTTPSGIQGVVTERDSTPDGGIAVVGYRDQPTTRIPNPGIEANAPVEISGQPVLIAGGAYLEVTQPLGEDHYLLIGQSTTFADGRHFAPLSVGPQYLPLQVETATDTRDIPLDGVGTPETVVTLGPIANSYAAIVSSFRYEVRLSEEGGRQSDFDVEIWYSDQGGPYSLVFRDEYALVGAPQNVQVSVPLDQGVAAGDSVQMRVSAIDSNPNSDPWVRGATRASLLELRQG